MYTLRSSRTLKKISKLLGVLRPLISKLLGVLRPVNQFRYTRAKGGRERETEKNKDAIHIHNDVLYKENV